MRATEGKIAAIKFAREHNIPYPGLCFGFQLATVEYARNVCGLKEANSIEIDLTTPHPVVCLLPEQGTIECKGGTMRLGAYPIAIVPNSLAHTLYSVDQIFERHQHRFEVNPAYIPILNRHGLAFTGKTVGGKRMEILETRNHYFFFATQFHPEFKSRPGRPDPAFYGFIKASLDRKLGRVKPVFNHELLDESEARFLRVSL